MADTLETEIKLAATPGMLALLRDHPALAGKDSSALLTTTYFDTEDARLNRAGIALRIRESADQRELTVKISAVPNMTTRRNEWTVPTRRDHPDIPSLPAKARELIAPVLGNLKLAPVAQTTIERLARRVKHCRSTIEIAFDRGDIHADTNSEPICELELELKSGELADLLALALKLPLGPNLQWSTRPKGERCHALAYDIPARAVRAGPIVLTPTQDVASGFRAIGWNCLEQLLANYPLVIASGDSEAVHQSRVAIRRLRAAMALFRKIVKGRKMRVLRAELRAVATQLGKVRDLDVLLDRIGPNTLPDDQEAAELFTHLRMRRQAALDASKAMLCSDQFQHLVMQVAFWLEAGAWTERCADGGGTLGPFAAEVLARRRRKLRRKAKHLGKLSDRARHRARIEAKKLRYGMGFFDSLYDHEDAGESKQLTKALGRLQDQLGTLNDMTTIEKKRSDLFDDLDPLTAAKLSAKLNNLDTKADALRAKLIKSAKKALARVRKADLPAA